MTNKIYLNANEVAEIMGVSKATAYKIMQRLNDELDAKGFITISGKVNKKYFIEKACYGAMNEERM